MPTRSVRDKVGGLQWASEKSVDEKVLRSQNGVIGGFVVALAASGGFVAGSATADLDWQVIAGLLLGGVKMNAHIIMAGNNFSSMAIAGVLIAVACLVITLTVAAWRREHRIGIEHSFFEESVD